MGPASTGRESTADFIADYLLDLVNTATSSLRTTMEDPSILLLRKFGKVEIELEGPQGFFPTHPDQQLVNSNLDRRGSLPSIVVEVSRSQTKREFLRKLESWIVGSRGMIKVAIGVKMPYGKDTTKHLYVLTPDETVASYAYKSQRIVSEDLSKPGPYSGPEYFELPLASFFATDEPTAPPLPDFSPSSLRIPIGPIVGSINENLALDADLDKQEEDQWGFLWPGNFFCGINSTRRCHGG